jgi:hypothetical protein
VYYVDAPIFKKTKQENLRWPAGVAGARFGAQGHNILTLFLKVNDTKIFFLDNSKVLL